MNEIGANCAILSSLNCIQQLHSEMLVDNPSGGLFCIVKLCFGTVPHNANCRLVLLVAMVFSLHSRLEQEWGWCRNTARQPE